jgi:small subunit ribosomal protein S7
MIEFALARNGLLRNEAFAQEIVDAHSNTGSVVKKNEDVQRMAQGNRVFAHMRW